MRPLRRQLSADRGGDQQSAPVYLRATVVNLARRSVRRMLRERRAWRDADDRRSADPGASVDLVRALARLPAGKRACVVLRFYLDLSEADTAAALGVSVGTMKSQTAKALRRLRRLLAPPRAGPAPRARPRPSGAWWVITRSPPVSRAPPARRPARPPP